MRWVRSLPPVALALALTSAGEAGAQAPTGYRVNGGRAIPRPYPGVVIRGPQATVIRGPQTVTDYQSLINAITSIPGWYGPPPQARPYHPERPQPTVPRASLLSDDGTILWPSATPDDPARRTAEEAVRAVVLEHRKYGRADNRRVADARNKLTAFARQVLPALKARNAADADGLERFIVELQKTLATLAVHY